MSYDEIFKIANALAAEGKTPTVALIRNRLSHPVPMPMLITALQRWKQSPHETPPAPEPLGDVRLDALPPQLVAALQPIYGELKALRQEVEALKARLDQQQDAS